MRNPQNDTRERNLNGASAKAGAQRSKKSGPRPAGDGVSERTCILTRATGSRDRMIRLALGPDGQVAPDVRARAPGRGAWIAVGRSALEDAHARGKLRGALGRAFKDANLVIPDDLGERIELALRAQALDRLGLEARGGSLLTGSERIEQAARAGKVHLLIHAGDAGEDGNRALDQAWRVGGGPTRGLVFPEPRTILSMALGRENVVHIALTDAAAARRVAQAISRWQAFIDPDAGLSGADAAGLGSNDDDIDEGNA